MNQDIDPNLLTSENFNKFSEKILEAVAAIEFYMRKCKKLEVQLNNEIVIKNIYKNTCGKLEKINKKFDKLILANDVELDFILENEDSEALIFHLMNNDYYLVKRDGRILFSYETEEDLN